MRRYPRKGKVRRIKKAVKRRVIPYVDPFATLVAPDRFVVTWMWPTAEHNEKLTVHGNTNHWDRQSIAKHWRGLAKIVCLEAGCPEWGQAVVHYRFYKPDLRAIDQLNQAHRMKHVVDGVMDAGLLHNDSDKYLVVGGPMESRLDRERPRIELEFVRVKEGA